VDSKIIHNAASVSREYSLLVAWEQWKFGYDIFMAGEDVSVCRSVQQRRGWWSALESQADAETYSYLSRGNR
jgi:hypothetical protein